MIQLVGTIGSFLLAICSFPEVIRTIKLKKAGIGFGMIIPWFFGGIFTLIYVITLHDKIVLTNVLSNLMAATIIGYYKIKYRPRKPKRIKIHPFVFSMPSLLSSQLTPSVHRFIHLKFISHMRDQFESNVLFELLKRLRKDLK